MPPPAPKTVARPTTEGACQVRLQESMLFVPMAVRMNFCAMKFISFVAFEHEKHAHRVGRRGRPRARRKPSAARSSASSHEAGRSRPVLADGVLRPHQGLGQPGVRASPCTASSRRHPLSTIGSVGNRTSARCGRTRRRPQTAPSMRAASSVFSSRQAMVIGPVPPGIGVMAPATAWTASKSTSPTMPASVRLTPDVDHRRPRAGRGPR